MSKFSRLINNAKIAALPLIGMLVMFANNASAVTTCSFKPGNNTFSGAIPLQAKNITVGPDTPDGTVIFNQYFGSHDSSFPPPEFTCTASATSYKVLTKYLYTLNPKPLSDWKGSPHSGQVYETGVPGLGVVVWYYGRAFPTDRSSGTVAANTVFDSSKAASMGAEFDMSIIKIGPVSPGTIKGSNLPNVSYQLIPEGGNTLKLSSLSFAGEINIVSQTCQTPDVNVPMGSMNINQTFTGLGSVSAWKDASVHLTNCPRFYGTNIRGRYHYHLTSGYIASSSPNTLSLKLTPNTTIIDSAKGILGIRTGTESASGVGIQMAYGKISDTSPTLVDFAGNKVFNMSSNTATTQTLPLVARYIQTDSQVTPGRADAAVTFIIDYK